MKIIATVPIIIGTSGSIANEPLKIVNVRVEGNKTIIEVEGTSKSANLFVEIDVGLTEYIEDDFELNGKQTFAVDKIFIAGTWIHLVSAEFGMDNQSVWVIGETNNPR